VQAFDDSKVGVKGLVGLGVTKISHMFYIGNLNNAENLGSDSKLSVPIIDFNDIHVNPAQHVKVIDRIQSACHEWRFFHETYGSHQSFHPRQ
jgi:hypothetical protein